MKIDELLYKNWEEYKFTIKQKLADLIEADLLVSKDKADEIFEILQPKSPKLKNELPQVESVHL